MRPAAQLVAYTNHTQIRMHAPWNAPRRTTCSAETMRPAAQLVAYTNRTKIRMHAPWNAPRRTTCSAETMRPAAQLVAYTNRTRCGRTHHGMHHGAQLVRRRPCGQPHSLSHILTAPDGDARTMECTTCSAETMWPAAQLIAYTNRTRCGRTHHGAPLVWRRPCGQPHSLLHTLTAPDADARTMECTTAHHLFGGDHAASRTACRIH